MQKESSIELLKSLTIETGLFSGCSLEYLDKLFARMLDSAVPCASLDRAWDSTRDTGFCSGQLTSSEKTVPWPVCRKGLPLNLVFQVDLGMFLPEPISQAGTLRLALFLSDDYRVRKDKERDWFRLLLLDKSSCLNQETNLFTLSASATLPVSLERKYVQGMLGQCQAALQAVEQDYEQLALAFNRLAIGSGQVFGDFGRAADLALVIAAFHANGVSYSLRRHQDLHYKHLVDSVRDWFVIMRLREKSIWDVSDDRDLWLCIRQQDWHTGAMEKCTVVFLSQ